MAACRSYNLMEDAATAEISRAQVWQWIEHGAKLNSGQPVTADLVRNVIPEELEKTRGLIGAARFDAGKFELAASLFEQMMTTRAFPDFLTLGAYEHID